MKNSSTVVVNKINNAKKLLIAHYIRMYLKILNSCIDTFGIGILFFYYLLKIPLMILYIHGFLFIDNIFFRKYIHVKIVQPVFIIGHPRSATTFLHTILTQTEEFLVFKSWELLNPSLTIRKLLRHSESLQTFFTLLIDLGYTPHRIRLALNHKKDGIGVAIQRHKQELRSIVQEEEILFQNILDTQLISIMTPLGFAKNGYPELCFNDEQAHQDKSIQFLENCFKRQIYYTGKKQIVAKMNFSLFRIKTLLKYFPDAKIIYLARSPLETIPSHLSLHRKFLDNFYGLNNIPSARLKQYFKHRYQYNILYYRHYDDLIRNSVIPREQLLEITYDSIKNNLGNVIQQIKSFTNLRFHPEMEDKLRRQAKTQSLYKRGHVNLPLEAFNLTETDIESDFDFVFKRYGFKRDECV